MGCTQLISCFDIVQSTFKKSGNLERDWRALSYGIVGGKGGGGGGGAHEAPTKLKTNAPLKRSHN